MRVVRSVLLVLLLVPGWSGDVRLEPLGRASPIRVEHVLLDSDAPARRRVGRLTFLGGIALANDDPAFGGFSALAVQGDRFTLLSDGGALVQFRMGAEWRPRSIAFGNLPAGPRTGWTKEDRDSESLAIDPASGRAWIGFESATSLWRYARGFRRAEGAVAPGGMRRWDEGGGPETLVRYPDGRFVTIAETSRWPGHRGRAGLMFAGDPIGGARHFRFEYRPPAGYNPSDAAVLPDGSLLVLNRRFRLPFRWSAKLTIVPAGAIRPGATVAGREIATLAAPLVTDNYEGVAVTREGEATIVWLVSDDNQSWLQRSLLLKFRLEPQPASVRRRSRSPAS